MNNNNEQTCAHANCNCTRQNDQQYCSDHCRDAAQNNSEVKCECGHPQCR